MKIRKTGKEAETMVNEAAVRTIFSDKVFAKELLSLETAQEVQTALKKKDMFLSVEELLELKELFARRPAPGEALSDAELDVVTGGLTAEETLMSINAKW